MILTNFAVLLKQKMDNNKIIKILEFAKELEKLKKLERFKGQVYWRDYPKPHHYESVADHTWRLGMLVMLMADRLSSKLNLEKALKMTLIHDIPEIEAGDGSPLGEEGTVETSYAFDKERAVVRHEEEEKAAGKVFSMLQKEDYEYYYNLWLEYENQGCIEAKVVKALDRIEALIQVLQYRDGNLFENHLEFTLKYALKDSGIDPAIAELANKVADEMRKKYNKFEK